METAQNPPEIAPRSTTEQVAQPTSSPAPVQKFTIAELLEVWATRSAGGHLDELPRWLLAATRTGGVGPDQTATAMMHYVESVPSFRNLRPALVWVLIYGKQPADFHPSVPGETHEAALLRMTWGEYLTIPRRNLCTALINSFRCDLEQMLKEKPFVPPQPLNPAPDAESIVARVTADVEGSLCKARAMATITREARRNRPK